MSKLVVFGDRLADNGNTAALEKSLGQAPGTSAAPYSTTGNFSDGPQWTTDLAQILGATAPSQQENFAFEDASARALGVADPFAPDASKTNLATFAGQIQQFAQQDGSFNSNELVAVNFGGNDISLPSNESPLQGVTDSVNAIISGLGQLADMGAKHFLVSNLPTSRWHPSSAIRRSRRRQVRRLPCSKASWLTSTLSSRPGWIPSRARPAST